MKLKIAAIAGSPRLRGNSTGLLTAALEAAKERGHDAKVLTARTLNVEPCIACGGCKRGPNCILDDEMHRVYAAIANCDALVVSTPVYYYGVSGWLKAIIDRTYALLDKDLLPRVRAGKRLYVITAQREADPDDGRAVVRQVERAFERLEMVPSGSLVGVGLDEAGEHLRRPELLEAARALID